MNKTVSINLGGFFFHIDEDAYQKLNRYFDAIRRSLSPDGKDEIMSDIEGRIAELLSEKIKNDKQVVGAREIDEVIAVMGQPEDYRIDEEAPEKENINAENGYTVYNDYAYMRSRKFFRDGDNAMISGVCAGIAHYFKIDPLWIRIIFVLSLFLSFGSSIFVYVLLWILIPKAITTTEKLEMKGEPINISNIEKKVKEEINTISEKFQNVDYEKLGANAKSGAEKIGSGLSSVFSAIFKAIAKVIGAIITIVAAVMLGSAVVGLLFFLFSSGVQGTFWYPYVNSFNYTETPMWLVIILIFFTTAIPLFALFLLGLKILVDNLKPIGNITKYTLLIIWIVSLISCIVLGLQQSAQLTNEGKTVVKKEIFISKDDTLHIKFRYNEYFTKHIDRHRDFSFEQDSLGNEIIYSNDIAFYVLKTDSDTPYVQIEKKAMGNSFTQARKTAENIKYNFEIEGNNLILDNYLLSASDTKYHRQRVEIFLYLPEGTYFQPDESVQEYDDTDDSFFNLWFDGDAYIYKMEKNEVKCLNCVTEEEDNDSINEDEHFEMNAKNGSIKIHNDDADVDINVNKDGIKVKTTNKTNNNNN
jgi:phage shock protein PspC (stress-responsive transcriptional regulator)